MRALWSALAGAAATVVLTLLLAALAPRETTEAPLVAPVRPLLRVPEAPADDSPPRLAAARGPGGGARGGGGRGSPTAPTVLPRATARTPRPFATPVLAGAAAPRTAIAWPARLEWPSDALAGVPSPIGDLLAAGAGAGSGGVGTGGSGRGGAGGTPAPRPPVRPAGITRRAIAQHAPQPAYPSSLRAREESGFVEALIHLDASGLVSSVDVASSSGSPLFEDAVRSTVARWRFSPALREGVPVATTIRRRFEFRMVDR